MVKATIGLDDDLTLLSLSITFILPEAKDLDLKYVQSFSLMNVTLCSISSFIVPSCFPIVEAVISLDDDVTFLLFLALLFNLVPAFSFLSEPKDLNMSVSCSTPATQFSMVRRQELRSLEHPPLGKEVKRRTKILKRRGEHYWLVDSIAVLLFVGFDKTEVNPNSNLMMR